MAATFEEDSKQFLASLDREIARLQRMREQVAAVLEPGSKKLPSTVRSKGRGMSEEGRLRIAEAQRARWAKQKGAIKKSAAKTSPVRKRAASKTASSKPAGKTKDQNH